MTMLTSLPPKLLGIIQSTYFGGRAEVHIRREIVRTLYCDFKAMYPTVCVLMGLWRFVIAERVRARSSTRTIRTLLDRIELEVLREPRTWRQLHALVQVLPDADIFPVRAAYDEGQRTIGVNRLTSETAQWFTLADCVASKLLTRKAPRVVRAITFEPVGIRDGLRPIDILGNPAYRVDPSTDDFYRCLIDLRDSIKDDMRAARQAGDIEKAERLKAEQNNIKTIANSTSYGIFQELNVTSLADEVSVMVYGGSGEPFEQHVSKVEKPGLYFQPLLGTLTTGAARLMLGITERLAEDRGLDWGFCDTDSMALAESKSMDEEDFLERAQEVIAWFNPLNPYKKKGSLLKVEDANFHLEDDKLTDQIEQLYCFAVSAKRYTLFNLNADGTPILRKVSAHGLGHLLPPYKEGEGPTSIPSPVVPLRDLECEQWHHDLWYRIVEAALGPTPEQVHLDDLPGFDRPAVSRYSASSPDLLRWFKQHNGGTAYRDQVRPFGFLLSFQSRQAVGNHRARPVSPYESDHRKAAAQCFDRESGAPVSPGELLIYAEVLAQYHLQPESKFLNGDYLDEGRTQRRHILATGNEVIGKEADRWEEQYYTGLNVGAQIEYGVGFDDLDREREVIKAECLRYSLRELSRATGLSHTHVRRLTLGTSALNTKSAAKLRTGLDFLRARTDGPPSTEAH
jgi:hypothetical protein